LVGAQPAFSRSIGTGWLLAAELFGMAPPPKIRLRFLRSSTANNLIRVHLWLPLAYLLWFDGSPGPVSWLEMHGATMEITT